MLKKPFDRLLEMHFQRQPDAGRLDRLEQDVWRRINTAKYSGVTGRIEEFLSVFAVPQFKTASLAMALVIGLSAGAVAVPAQSAQAFSPGSAMGLDIFNMHAPYLPSTAFENMPKNP